MQAASIVVIAPPGSESRLTAETFVKRSETIWRPCIMMSDGFCTTDTPAAFAPSCAKLLTIAGIQV